MRRYRKLILFLVISITALIAVPTIAVVVNLGNKCISVKVTDSNRKYVTYIKRTADNGYAYCLDEQLNSPNGMDMPVGGLVSDPVFRVLNFGYPNYNYTNNEDANYLITQFALWHILGQIDAGSLNYQADSSIQATGFRHTDYGSTYTGPLTGDYVKACIIDLITVAQIHPANQTASFGVTPKTSGGAVSGDFILSDSFTVQASGTSVPNAGSLKLTPSTNIPGLVIVKNGQIFDINSYQLQVGESFQLGVPKYTPSGSVTFKVSGTVTAKQVFTLQSTSSIVQNVAAYQTRTVDASVVDAFTFNWQKAQSKGTVRLAKKDSETKKMLAGAKFGIYSLDGKLIQEATTGSNGIATFADIPSGSYDLKEIQAPAGYELNTTPIRVDITDGTSDVTLDFTCENKPLYHKITIKKRDSETNVSLGGAKFGLYQGDTLIQEQTTRSSGMAEFTNVKSGVYTIKEIEAPLNYKLSDSVTTVDLSTATKVQNLQYQFTNDAIKHKIELTKTDSVTYAYVEGAEYSLYANGSPYPTATAVTNASGELVFDNVTPGSYIVKETKAPPNYELSAEEFPVVVEKSTESKTYKISAKDTPIKHKIQVIKKDKETGALLAGAKFGLYKNGVLKQEKTTNSQGVVEFTDINAGSYEIKEMTAPVNYLLSNEVINVDIGDKTSAETLSFDFLDEPIKHKINVIKSDGDSNKLLEGVVFGLFEGDKEIARATTNAQGVATFTNVKTGNYIIKELETIPDYSLSDETITVNIGDRTKSETFQFKFKNYRLKHKIVVTKIDSETKQPVAGATLAIYNGSQLLSKSLTDDNGIVTFGNLSSGTYTIKEVDAPPNYNLSDKTITVTIGEESTSQTIQKTFENTPIKHKVTVLKTDAESNKVLQGVVFGLFQNNNEIARATTDSKGIATFDNIKKGNYVIKELETIDDYTLSDREINVDIDDQTSAKTFEYTFTNAPLKHKIVVTKIDSETKQPLQGALLALYKGDSLISKARSNAQGIVEFTDLRDGVYTIKEVEAPINFKLSKATVEVNIANQTSSNTFTATFENEPILNKITVTKLDGDTGAKLQGAEFALLKDGNEVARAVTDTKGIATFSNLRAGNYQIKETKAPVNYTLNDKIVDITINDSDKEQTVNYDFNDESVKHEIVLTKTDKENNKTLKDAVYGLYLDGNIVKKGTTDENGKIVFSDLKTGNYIIKEITPPVNYYLSDEEISVNMGNQTSSQTFTVEAKDVPIKHKVQVNKVDAVSREPVAGAVFAIYQNDTEIARATSNDKGIALFENLRPGNYTIKEVEVPPNYHLNKEVINVEITDATKAKTYVFEFENEQIQHKIIVTKTDRETGEPLSDTVFGVYQNDKLIRKGKTNENGEVTFTAMLKGEYEIKELIPPINHLLDSKPQTLRIVNQSASQKFKVRFDNGYIPNNIIVVKKDSETKELISGAEFALYQDGKEIARATSNEQGEAKFENLRNGKYTVKEINPPINYFLNEQEIEVNIKDSTESQTLTYDFENTPVKHKIIVNKEDSENSNKLEGAKFGLYQGDDKVAEGVTNEQGQVVFENLRKGEYTIKELEAPTGFRLNEESINVTIGDNTESQVFEETFKNEPIKFTLNVYKREYFEDKSIEGVKFRLVSDGKIVYFPLEINADESEETENSTENKQSIAFSDVIEDKNVLTSLDDSDAPEGMTSVFTTNADGSIEFPVKLRYGNYELIELEAKEGYKPLEDTIKFTVDENTKMGDDLDNLVYTSVVENHIGEGEMELTKQDVSTGELLPNAKFKIYAEDKETVVAKGITDENGIAKFKLEIGKYYYQEYEAPVGYELDDSLFEFEIKANKEIVKCQMTNTPNPKLPKTGAVGSIFPVVIVCTLISLACAGYIIIRKGSKK